MGKSIEEKLKREQLDRLTVKKGEIHFLTDAEIKNLQIKYSTFKGKKKKSEL